MLVKHLDSKVLKHYFQQVRNPTEISNNTCTLTVKHMLTHSFTVP